jgi:hypothetical protein
MLAGRCRGGGWQCVALQGCIPCWEGASFGAVALTAFAAWSTVMACVGVVVQITYRVDCRPMRMLNLGEWMHLCVVEVAGSRVEFKVGVGEV